MLEKLEKKISYSGAGSPSASHSIINGLSLSSALDLTWNNNSSVGGCLIILGGLCTVKERKLGKVYTYVEVRMLNWLVCLRLTG